MKKIFIYICILFCAGCSTTKAIVGATAVGVATSLALGATPAVTGGVVAAGAGVVVGKKIVKKLQE